MVIDKIEEGKELKSEKTAEKKQKEWANWFKMFKKLRDEFNSEAEKMNLRYKIILSKEGNSSYLYYIKKWWIFTEKIEISVIFYYDDFGDKKDIYYIQKELDFKVFKAIEPILNKINCKFYIKLKNGEIPTKYKIVEVL